MSYWRECVECALDEAGVEATEKQLDEIARSIEFAAGMEFEATGREHIPNPLQFENARLASELAVEKEKVVCPACKGSRKNISHGPHHSATSRCWVCYGEGRCLHRDIPTNLREEK